MAKVYTLTIKNRIAAIVIAIAILGLGAVFFTVGLALLAGLAVAGGAIGAGYGLLRRIRGGGTSGFRSISVVTTQLHASIRLHEFQRICLWAKLAPPFACMLRTVLSWLWPTPTRSGNSSTLVEGTYPRIGWNH